MTAMNTVLLKISDYNPVKVKFTISENEYLTLMKARNEKDANALTGLYLILSDGSKYSEGEGSSKSTRVLPMAPAPLPSRRNFPMKTGSCCRECLPGWRQTPG